MRLPWPFSRSQRSASDDAAAALSGSAAGPVFTATPRGPQAWRDLPVLATSVGRPPLVAPTPPFRANLAGAAPAPIMLAPLTHGRSLDAPHGLVGDIAHVTQRSASTNGSSGLSSVPLAVRRPRRAEPVSEASSEPSMAPEPQTAVVPAASRPPGAVMPVRHVPVADVPQPARASLVSAAAQPLPPPPAGRVGTAQAAGRAQLAPIAHTPAARAPATPALAVISAVTSAPPPAPSPTAPDRLTLGQSRRLGLGAPIDPLTFKRARVQPATMSTVPGAARAASPAALPLAAPAPAPNAETTSPAPAATAAQSLPETEPSPGAPQLPVPSPQSVGRTHAQPGSTHTQRSEPKPVAMSRARVASQTARAPAAPSPAPLLGARPVPRTVQRAPLATQAAAAGVQPAMIAGGATRGAPSTGPVRIRRGSEANEMAASLQARAFTQDGEIYLPDGHGPLSGEAAQSLVAHEMVHVAQQRRLGSALPSEDSSHGQQLEAQAVAAERGDQLPLPRAPERTHSTPSTETNVTLPSAWDMTIAATPAAAATPTAQRAPDAKFTDPDDEFRDKLDSNEEYLFGRFERRLRRQLISERERGGTLIDAL